MPIGDTPAVAAGPSARSVVPVAVFAHRRADTLAAVLACLRDQRVPLMYVFVDGPARPEHEADVNAVREIVRAIDWCECRLDISEGNRGLGVSIKRAVGQVLARHEAAIFIEDDLVTVPGTYAYLCQALKAYRDDPRVMSVTGWTHPRITPAGVGTMPYFDGKGECWVWGTWARCWPGMETPALEIMRRCEAAGIDIRRYGPDMPHMAEEAAARNLWAIGWWYHHLLHGGLCLRPPWSTAEQICWDAERSTTTNISMAAWMNPPLRACPPVPQAWPEPREHEACVPLWRQAVAG